MTTIKDIAEIAGVSIATVSNALNDNGKAKPEMREKIINIAQELNYIPNINARNLKTKKSNIIGVISEEITSFNMGNIINGICEYVEEEGYMIILNNLRYSNILSDDKNYYQSIYNYKDRVNKLAKQLIVQHVDGIIYIGSHDKNVSGLIDITEKPIIYTYCHINNSAKGNEYSINYDDKGAAYVATKHLIDNGHTKIAIICGSMDSIPCSRRMQGYNEALSESNLSINPKYIKVAQWEDEISNNCAHELFELDDPPTAIFAMSDKMALGVMTAAYERGINIPNDISIVGFDNIDCSKFCSPKLSTIGVPYYEMGMKSGQMIIDVLRNKKVDKNNMLRCYLHKRDSVCDIK